MKRQTDRKADMLVIFKRLQLRSISKLSQFTEEQVEGIEETAPELATQVILKREYLQNWETKSLGPRDNRRRKEKCHG